MSVRNRRNTEPDLEALLKRYRNLNGAQFSGNESIIQTQAWMSSVERIFERIQLRDDQKQLVASWALKEEALIWWETIIKDNPEGDITWDIFKVIFLERFTPPEAMERLCDEFSYLIQGDMTIPEYHKKFNELSHFAPHLIQDPKRKYLRFIHGLQRRYQNSVLRNVKLPFSEMIYMAYQYEDLHKKGMLCDEEEVSSSDKAESETDIAEASTRFEANKKPSANRKRARSKKELATTAIYNNCHKPGHFQGNCKPSEKQIKSGSKSGKKFQENRKCSQCHEAGHLSKACPLFIKPEAD